MAGEGKRDRLHHGLRDMVLSLVALMLIIGVVMFLSRGCTFDPGTPEADPATAPTIDAAADLTRYARTADFAIRSPEVPTQWRANSTSSAPVTPVTVVLRVGWLTPARFMQLSQSAAPMADLVRVETDQPDPASTGRVDAGGQSWTVYPARRSEKAWAVTVDGVTLLITGSGTEDEFRALATATLAAKPLPRQ